MTDRNTPYGTDPQEWVAVYAANIRNLGTQMSQALRRLETSRGAH